jgi:hypothetical protein
VVGTGRVGVVGEVEALFPDNAPRLLDKATANPEFQGSFNKGEVLFIFVSDSSISNNRS